MKAFEAEWRARFERFGRTHAEEHAISGWSAEGLARRFRLFQGVAADLPLPPRARVLELGCGAGTYVRYLAGLGYRVVGVDYAVPCLHRAMAADPQRVGRYAAADAYALPFAAKCFDLVVCIGVLQALTRPDHLLDEIARVLGPQGVLVVEALNSLEVPALILRLLEVLRLRRSRVRFYSSFQVRRWLGERNMRPLRQVNVYLPPRSLPALGWLLDRPAVVRALESVPGGSLLGAHAIWLVSQRER